MQPTSVKIQISLACRAPALRQREPEKLRVGGHRQNDLVVSADVHGQVRQRHPTGPGERCGKLKPIRTVRERPREDQRVRRRKSSCEDGSQTKAGLRSKSMSAPFLFGASQLKKNAATFNLLGGN